MDQKTHRRPRKRRALPQARTQAANAHARAQVRARQNRFWRGALLLIVLALLAVVLRSIGLTRQSLWADEGNSVRLTERPLPLVIDAARADIHPPGYYVLLWGWVKVLGQGEAAVRSLSVVIGVALVALVYALGVRWLGARAGWLGAFCAAVSPFLVMYSQEVRMYILVAFLSTAATYAYGRWIEGGSRRHRIIWSVAYVLAAAAGLWTHYSFPVVLAALNAAWLVWWVRGLRQERHWGGLPHAAALGLWVGLHLLVVVLYAPWLSTAWAKIWGYGAISQPYAASYIVSQALKLLSVGETVPADDLTRWLTVGIVGLAVFGAWGGLAPRDTQGRRLLPEFTLSLVLVVLAPIALMLGLALAGRPAFRPKFFLVASPAFGLLVGEGIALLERSTGSRRNLSNVLWLLLGIGLVGVGSARSLRNYYLNPSYARSDYRGIAEQIGRVEKRGDAILLNAPNQWEVFTYYYKGPSTVYPVCRSRPPRESEVIAELEQIAADHGRVFALYWATEESDPDSIVERWMAAHAYKASDEWYGDVRLVTYALGSHADQSEPEHDLTEIHFGESIALRGYTMQPERPAQGDIVQLVLFWEALQVPPARYKVFVHLVREGELVSQMDGEPGGGLDLTTRWSPERGMVVDRYGLLIPESAPVGRYEVVVGMYDFSGAPRLSVSVNRSAAGDALVLAKLDLE